MGAVVDLPQSLGVDVAVHLRRRERGVAEQLLDRAQVGAALEQVRRERVAQAVRVGDEPAQRRGVEPAAARREEERVLGAACELRAAPRAGSARRGAPPPRRAARPGPSRPCRRARGRAPARSRRRRGRGRPPRRCAGRPSRRARRARGCAARAGRRRRAPSTICLDLVAASARRAAGAARFGASDASGTCSGPSVKRSSAAHRGELARDRRGRELAALGARGRARPPSRRARGRRRPRPGCRARTSARTRAGRRA